MPQPDDPVKRALADLVFSALKWALSDLGVGPAWDPAHEPLEDCVIEVVQYSDLAALVSVAGHGRKQWYTVEIKTDSGKP